MVTITADAIAEVEAFIASAGTEPMDWFVIISWRKGAADNRRTADGEVAWSIVPTAPFGLKPTPAPVQVSTIEWTSAKTADTCR